MSDQRHPVHEILPFGQMFTYGFQHVLAMYAGAVAVPLILAGALHLPVDQLIFLINADLFTCGLATVIQTMGFWKFGVRIPVIQGVTFAAVTPMIMIGKVHGLTGIYGAVIVGGLATLLVAPYFSRLIRFFPPVVTGSIISIIGISLLPVAVRWVGGGNPAAPDFATAPQISLSGIVLVMILCFNRYFTGFLKNIAVLLGLIIGTLMAIPLGFVDFSSVMKASWLGMTTPFAFGLPTFDITAIFSMVLVMIVVMVETTGDFIAIGEIIDKPISQDDLTRGLRADGLSTILGGILNCFPYTAFAQNVGLIGLTGVKSRFVVAMSGVILMILGLFPKMAAIVASVPAAVLGGAGLVMFGVVAASGIRTLAKVDFNDSQNLMIVAVSLAIGLIPLAMPNFYDKFPEWTQVVMHSGITAGSLTAVILNAALNYGKNHHDFTTSISGK